MKRSSVSSCDTSHYPKDVPWEVPEGWCWTTIGDCLINRDGERIPISSEIRIKQKNKVFDYYGAAGVIDKVDDYLFNERLLLIGEDGANLLSRAKDNAFFAEGKYWVNNHAHILDATRKPLLDYIALYINSIALDPYITGSAQPKLNQDNLNRIPVPLPPFMEQLRIIDSMAQSQVIIDLIAEKQKEIVDAVSIAKSKVLDLAIHGKLVPQDPSDEPAIELLKRINPTFKSSDNLHYEGVLPLGWVLCRLEDIIEYEQPQAYIVESTDYSDKFEVPVLTPGKSFILGYTNESRGICNRLPVIIFDDFTTESKYVDFPFKVKSSAMKILRVKDAIDIRYIAFFMSITRLASDTHKRYWISEYSKLSVPLPPLQEQKRIVSKVTELSKQLNLLLSDIQRD